MDLFNFILSYIFLQQSGGPENGMSSLILMIGMMVIMFIFFFLPQMRRQKKEKQFRDGLQVGDKIITTSGIFGRVLAIDDKTVTLEIDKGVSIKIEKSFVRSYVDPIIK